MDERDERDDDLRAQLDRMPRDVPPGRDLWPGIAQGIARSPRGRSVRIAAAVSVLALAAGVAVAIGLRAGPHPAGPVASAFPPPLSSTPGEPATAPAPLPGEAEYEGAERALSSELQARRDTLPGAEVRVLDDSLRLFDDAIDSTREAVRAHPEDAELRAELDRVWEDKIDLLRQATEQPEEK